MDQNMHFEMRYKKLTVEALLKSLFCGLSVALGADFVLGTVFWAAGIQNFPLALGLLCGTFVLVTCVAGTLFYFAKFKPTITSNARRIDSLGLEERVITMIEYKDSDSVIANLQREDAIQALGRVDEKSIKLRFGRKIFICLAICAVCGLGMSTVASLSSLGLLPSGSDIVAAVIPEDPPVYIPVSYMAEDGGYIEGEMEQLILLGENAEQVMAVPEEGYSFEGWDDGYKKPARLDKEIDHPLVLTAIFLPLENEGEDPGDGESGDSGEGPTENNGDSGGQPGDSDTQGDGGDGESGSSKYNKANQIINGETYYREFLEEYQDKIMEILKKSTEELTEEERAIIEAYINIV